MLKLILWTVFSSPPNKASLYIIGCALQALPFRQSSFYNHHIEPSTMPSMWPAAVTSPSMTTENVKGPRTRTNSHSIQRNIMPTEYPPRQLARPRAYSHSMQSPVRPEYPSQQSASGPRTYSQPNSRQWNTVPPESLPQWSPAQIVRRPRILFYDKHDPYYGFTNFSAHPVIYKGARYPTSEHLFQSFKFRKHRPELAEHIRTFSEKPSVAFSEARRYHPEVRSDWKRVNISKMDETLLLKFRQHPDLKAELLATGNAELVENSYKDSFWGVGSDGRGRNELGKALERLRAKLR